MRLRSRRLSEPEALVRTRSDFVVKAIRGSGPGGQHRNKVATGVRITDKRTGLTAEATKSRSQSINKAEAFEKLALRLVAYYEAEQSGGVLRRMSLGWGSKIRTYHEVRGVVKDHRTGEERPYRDVLDGGIDGFGQG